MSFSLESLMLLVTFGSVLVAVKGETWYADRQGLKKVSPTGWTAIGIGFVACCLGIGKTWYESADKDRDRQEIVHLKQASDRASERYGNLRAAIITSFKDVEVTMPANL